MQISKYKHPAKHLKRSPNVINPPQSDSDGESPEQDARSPLQRAMEAVDAQSNASASEAITVNSQRSPTRQSADSLDELLEKELQVTLSSKFE